MHNNNTKLNEVQVAEIYYLGTEGCPCCKVPLTAKVLAKAYGVSASSTSRIIRGIQRHTPPVNVGTRQDLVDLRKRVYERGRA